MRTGFDLVMVDDVTDADHRLWCAVLTHALHEAAKGTDTGWIGSRDFRLVCDLAGLDPQAVQARFDPERYRQAIRAA